MSALYDAIPAEPDVPSPGMLSTRYLQDDARARFDRENRLLGMCGLDVDAVFIGDSLTADWPADKLLCDLFPLAVNRGVGGDCAAHLGRRLDADVFHLRPRNVALLIGHNDVSYRFGHDPDAAILDDYRRNMAAILARLRASPARVFVGTLPPARRMLLRDGEYESKERLIPRMNDVVRDLVARLGLFLVDYYPHFLDDAGRARDDLFTDGCHHSARGQYLLALALRRSAEQARDASGGHERA